MPVIIGSALLVGAAAAAVTIASLNTSVPTASPPGADERTTTRDATPVEPVEEITAAAPTPMQGGDGVTSVELVEVALSVQPIVRTPPVYPPSALKQGLEGHVQLKFDVTAAGVVENVSVVESSDAQFEESAISALRQWRYLPRVVAGKRAGSEGVHTIIRFALAKESDSPKLFSDEAAEAAMREAASFSAGLEVAIDRLAADNFRGAELQLDEMQAIYGGDRADLWSFYGYLYTVQGNYDRAIDAYERSAAIYLASPSPTSAASTPLANLYYARHQYDLALRTLLRPLQAATAAGRPLRLSPDGEALIERLRALGVTEETL